MYISVNKTKDIRIHKNVSNLYIGIYRNVPTFLLVLKVLFVFIFNIFEPNKGHLETNLFIDAKHLMFGTDCETNIN